MAGCAGQIHFASPILKYQYSRPDPHALTRAFEYLPEKKGEGWKVLRIEDGEGRIHFPGLESVRAYIRMHCVGYSIEEGKIYEGG
jgi:hypothetical protein